MVKNRFEKQVVLVSGGATGVGAAAVRLFAEEGASVAIVDNNNAAGKTLAAELVAAGHRALFLAADVSEAGQVSAAVEDCIAAFGTIHVLFNHAGTITIKPFLDIEEQDWDRLFAINVKSMFLMTKAVLPHMLARGGGAIVCTASISARYATPMEVLYDATKAACQMFARAIAVEFRDRNIRCNTVSPGFIDTPHGRREVKELTALGVDVSEATMAAQQGRMCRPEEVAKAVLFLASEESSFVTGTDLVVDNGFSAV